MVIGKPAPFVSAFVDAVDAAIRVHQPHHAMSVTQRTWLAFCITAVLVTNSICWARFERASLGTYAMAALSWMFRHSKIPWDQLLGASVRVILQHHGITSGSLVIDDTDNPRSKSAKALAYLYKLRDKSSGGYLWGQSLVFLVLVTPKISLPVGVVFYQPAPELSAWYKTVKALKKQGVPPKQRPRKPAPHPQYPTKEQLALRLLEAFKTQHPDVRIHAVMADALYGTATFVDGASALFHGGQVISQIRSNQNIRWCTCPLRIIVFAPNPGKIPSLHCQVRGLCHDSTPILLPADGAGTAVVMCHVASCLAQPVRCDHAEVSQAHHATASTFPRTHTVCRSHAQTSLRCVCTRRHASPSDPAHATRTDAPDEPAPAYS